MHTEEVCSTTLSLVPYRIRSPPRVLRSLAMFQRYMAA